MPAQTYDQVYTTNYPRWGGTTARNYTSPQLHTVALTDLAPATTCAPAICLPICHCILRMHCRTARTLLSVWDLMAGAPDGRAGDGMLGGLASQRVREGQGKLPSGLLQSPRLHAEQACAAGKGNAGTASPCVCTLKLGMSNAPQVLVPRGRRKHIQPAVQLHVAACPRRAQGPGPWGMSVAHLLLTSCTTSCPVLTPIIPLSGCPTQAAA